MKEHRWLPKEMDAWDDQQLLAQILSDCLPPQRATAVAFKLLERYDSFAQVLEADPQELLQMRGLGVSSVSLLQEYPYLYLRYLRSGMVPKPCLKTVSQRVDLALKLCRDLPYEVLYLVSLNTQQRLNHASLIHDGTRCETPPLPKVIIEQALVHQAKSVVLVHNHPQQEAAPSTADINLTWMIMNALQHLSIGVEDHIIVGKDGYYSFTEGGYFGDLRSMAQP